MKYRLNTTNYHDFATFAVNKLPARSYFIPYPGRAAADAVAPKQKRYASPKVQCLNGEWDFKFYPRPAELPVELDTDAVHFDKLDVPSCWQFRGYDKPFYVNIRYQFPYKPPVIPTTGKVSRAFSWLGCDLFRFLQDVFCCLVFPFCPGLTDIGGIRNKLIGSCSIRVNFCVMIHNIYSTKNSSQFQTQFNIMYCSL